MKAITLLGTSNKGKTDTLKKFIKLLLANKAECKAIEGVSRIPSFITPKRLDRIDKYNDISIKVAFMNRCIGITTHGDRVDILKDKFNLLSNCDYFICASHPDHETLSYVIEVDTKHSPIVINQRIVNICDIGDSLADCQEKSNSKMADQLFMILVNELNKTCLTK